MNKRTIVLILSLFLINCIYAQSVMDRKAIYTALESSKTSLIDAQLNVIKTNAATGAFEGALLMRKAGTLSVPAKKLATFKEGYKRLEAAISKSPDNAEYRFLRLMIQENAPRSLGYYKNINEDSQIVKSNFRSMAEVVQKSIITYSKRSKSLATAGF